ncbi:hypothetical protein E2320_018993, partial [Naja naja]
KPAELLRFRNLQP